MYFVCKPLQIFNCGAALPSTLTSETMHKAITLTHLFFMAAALPAWHTEVWFLKRTTCSYRAMWGSRFWDASHLSCGCPHHRSSLGTAPPAWHKSGTEMLSQETNSHTDSRVQGCWLSPGKELTTQLQLSRCTASKCIGTTSTQVCTV